MKKTCGGVSALGLRVSGRAARSLVGLGIVVALWPQAGAETHKSRLEQPGARSL